MGPLRHHLDLAGPPRPLPLVDVLCQRGRGLDPGSGVAVATMPSFRFVRPLLGTGFCGALTTFSAVVVTADQLFAHGHQGIAITYLAASALAGLVAAALGLILGRAAVDGRRRVRDKRSYT